MGVDGLVDVGGVKPLVAVGLELVKVESVVLVADGGSLMNVASASDITAPTLVVEVLGPTVIELFVVEERETLEDAVAEDSESV